MFLVEGAKSVVELLSSPFDIKTLIATEVFLKDHNQAISFLKGKTEVLAAEEATLSSLSSFKNNNAAIAAVEMPVLPPLTAAPDEYMLVLDHISDPGNLGTLVRIADWYGIRKIVCSPETTDVYSPKVIHASMGSFLRVQVYYIDLPAFVSGAGLTVYGTFPGRGESVHTAAFGRGGLLVLGNEAEGISLSLEAYVSRHLWIPKYGEAESLNVAVAAAIICDNVRRSAAKQS